MTSDYSMLESGLERWVNFGKEEFVGRERLLAEHQAGAKRQFVTLTVDDPEDGEPFGEAVYLSTVNADNRAAGLVVSAGYGHRTRKSIAMAVLDKDTIFADAQLSITVLGRKRTAHLVDGGVLYDPDNARMKV